LHIFFDKNELLTHESENCSHKPQPRSPPKCPFEIIDLNDDNEEVKEVVELEPSF
jgi:hypothetical protein